MIFSDLRFTATLYIVIPLQIFNRKCKYFMAFRYLCRVSLAITAVNMRTNKRGLTQAYDLRDFSYDACMAFRETLRKADGKLALTRDDCMSVVSLVKAWEGAVDAVRVLRGKPLPGSLRPQSKPTKKKQISSAPSEQPSDSMPTDHTK